MSLRKRVHIGKYAVPVLLLLALVVGTVAATVYVVLTWTMSLTVVAYPRANFYEWSTTTRKNEFTESFNIFPNVTTIQDNATHGLYSNASGLCSMRIKTNITLDNNIEDVYIKVFEKGADPIREITWSTNKDAWMPFTTGTGIKIYTIWIEVTGASTATAPGSSSVDLEMRVETP